MKSPERKLEELVNASGFVFQLAMEKHLLDTKAEHGWQVEVREYPWKSTRQHGYADLVLSKGPFNVVVEFKRPRDAEWIFLMPDKGQIGRSHARVLWTNTRPHRAPLWDWDDIQIYPNSPECEFCVIRGQGETDRPMLERLANGVVESAEGLAADLITLTERETRTHIVLPVIVTTAALRLCMFDPMDVSLTTGVLDRMQFEDVRHLRFRRSLASAAVPDEFLPERLEDLSAASVRTVFVVAANFFAEWLSSVETKHNPGAMPWDYARGRADAEGR